MRFHIETLGCKVNQFESSSLETILVNRGHTPVSHGGMCDVIIVNSCAVTGDASRQSRQAARRLLRDYPDAILAVCGCASQIAPGEMEKIGASLIGGSGDRRKFVDELESLVIAKKESAINIAGDPKTRHTIELLPSGAPDSRTRAMLKIQDGCDNYCSYCVIPYARGHVRSLPPGAAVSEAVTLHGYREIVLTGIEISSYGKDLDGSPTLAGVVCDISNAVPDIRLRLGSLEPSMITAEFVEKLRSAPNLCEHFHLSLQSGSDSVLSRMRRKYTTEDFFNVLCLLREHFPNCGATTDVIMGFPGETETEVRETLDFLEKCAFSRVHVFPYSKRPGTKAASMPDQIQNAEKKDRAARARAVGIHTAKAFMASQVGKTLEVLFESETGGMVFGHARNYVEVAKRSADKLRNELIGVEIVSVDGDYCIGE